ncbi:hypothetical protein [Thalassoroseus pseudoceratinae]|uniref:hypothetical protein n=1 Tax=Thalassoroseus pseudoceratinae TaxID=2713176 RepID=UPI00142350FE|nr:hypothetical protein [Thalassoroseus pseudoceratinae]
MASRWLAGFLLVACLGCETETAPETAVPAHNADASAFDTPPDPRYPVVPAESAQLKPLADNSLTTEEYIRLGLPAPDREWIGSEFTGIAAIIGQLAQRDATQLPRYQSPKSGDVFARLVSTENLEFYRNSQVPMQQRMPASLAHTQGLNTVFWNYLSLSAQQSGLSGEIVELAGAQMQLSLVIRELATELLPQLDPNDPTYPVRMEGYNRMKKGFAMTFTGCLQMLSETDRYEMKDLKRLLTHVQATLPQMMPHLSEGSQLENLVSIEKLIENPELEELRPELKKLYTQLKSQRDGSG